MSAELIAGDRVSFLQNGRKLRGVVADYMGMKARGEELEVPIIRPRKRKIATAAVDGHPKLKIRWVKRTLLRKLPD